MQNARASTKEVSVFGFRLQLDSLGFSQLMSPYKKRLALGCLLVMMSNVIMVLLPILLNGGVSIIESDRPFTLKLLFAEYHLDTVYWIVGVVIALALISAIIRTLSRMLIFGVGRTIEHDVRAKLFFHISTLDDRFYGKNSVGDLMTHLTTDITNVRMVAGFAALNSMNIVFVFCFTVPLLLRIDTTLALCALLPFPLVVIATFGISKKMFHATIDYQERLSEMVSHIQENLLGAHVVRLFHQQDQEEIRFDQTNRATYRAGLKLARVRVLMMPIMRLMLGIAVGLVLLVGGHAVLSKQITLGEFVEVNARILQLAWPAMSVGFIMTIYSRGLASLNRINKLLTKRPEICDGDETLDGLHQLNVRNLVVKRDKPQQKDRISFSLSRKQTLAVVGPSGSHKTALLKAIYRRSTVPDGVIFFDGHDINQLQLKDLYRQVSVVTQESYLFHMSVRDNICFARPDVDPCELDRVLKITRLDIDAQSFPQGIDTMVGERGITLSGGQRQRVALARALLAKRPMIILDDALSSVDADTEDHIVKNLLRYLKDAMVILATHRMSAIRSADNILVMDNGAVIDEGTHDQLLHRCDLYQQLWGIEQIKGRLS